MVTRRQTIIGLSSAAVGGAAVSAGSFTSSASADADMRVVVISELRLEPARDDEQYVTTDEDGELVIAIESLNRNALTEFGDLVRVVNNGDVAYDELRFEFDAEDADGAGDIADPLGITAEIEVENDGGTFTLAPADGLGPGDAVGFGVLVDLLPKSESGISDFPDSTAELQLEITAARDAES